MKGIFDNCKFAPLPSLPLPSQRIGRNEEFVLPEFWHVVITEENKKTLAKWRFKHQDILLNAFIGGVVGISPNYPDLRCHNTSIDNSWGKGSVEITFEQFKKYVLKEKTMNTFGLKIGDKLQTEIINEWAKVDTNRWHKSHNEWHSCNVSFRTDREIEKFEIKDGILGFLVSDTIEVYLKCEGFLEFKENFNKDKEKTMEKEIVGWKLVKPEYREAAIKITGFCKGGITSFEEWMLTSNLEFADLLKRAGVLELWFEPVFAPDKPKLPTINGKQCIDNGDETITCGCTTKSFDWILGLEYGMGDDDINISDTKVTLKQIRQIVEYIKNK